MYDWRYSKTVTSYRISMHCFGTLPIPILIFPRVNIAIHSFAYFLKNEERRFVNNGPLLAAIFLCKTIHYHFGPSINDVTFIGKKGTLQKRDYFLYKMKVTREIMVFDKLEILFHVVYGRPKFSQKANGEMSKQGINHACPTDFWLSSGKPQRISGR